MGRKCFIDQSSEGSSDNSNGVDSHVVANSDDEEACDNDSLEKESGSGDDDNDGALKWIYFCGCNPEKSEVIESLGIDAIVEQDIKGKFSFPNCGTSV